MYNVALSVCVRSLIFIEASKMYLSRREVLSHYKPIYSYNNAISGRLPAKPVILLHGIMIMIRNCFGSNHYFSITHLRHIFVISHEVPL